MSSAAAAPGTLASPSGPRVASSPALSPTTTSTSNSNTQSSSIGWSDARLAALSPASIALALNTKAALAAAAAQSSNDSSIAVTGSLRIRVIQVTDFPVLPTAADASALSSWLRYSSRRLSSTKSRSDAAAAATGMICMLLKCTGSSTVLATASLPSASTISWNEEFYVDHVSASDEFKFFCVDRTKNAPYASLPLRTDIAASPGFIGKVTVPLSRLPEDEEIEQWYPLVPKETYLSLRTALRLALCFTPRTSKQRRTRVDSTTQLQTQSRRGLGPVSSTTPNGALAKLTIGIPPTPSPLLQSPVSISLQTGVVDYVIVVGAARDGTTATTAINSLESAVLFRYPALDRPRFPLPTKIEWFCFPGGCEAVVQSQRPPTTRFSFVLVGGTDGVSRTYAMCLTVYHRMKRSEPSGSDGSQAVRANTEWHATCVAFLTRVPLVDALEQCLLTVAHTWLAANAPATGMTTTTTNETQQRRPEALLVDLCDRVLIPIRGVFGVQFDLVADRPPVTLVLPSTASIYSSERQRPASLATSATRLPSSRVSPTKSPSTTNFISIQQGLEPLTYSLAVVFELLDPKTVIHLVALVLCEYRVLLHSTQRALLCPFAEALGALIYPFKWHHPYVPILPRVLAEYLQAPLPYVLGVHSSWLGELLANGRPEHLVVVDLDRGTLDVDEPAGPLLPSRLTKGLLARLKHILYPSEPLATPSDDVGDGVGVDSNTVESPSVLRPLIRWDARVETQVRTEFVCYLASMLMGYRDCLFFVHEQLPVFNKRRFVANCVRDSDVVPFVTRLVCTQAFQTFLETHSASDLSVFHAVYLTLARTKDVAWPRAMPLLTIAPPLRSTSGSSNTPVFVMPTSAAECDSRIDKRAAAPNSQDAMEHDDAADASTAATVTDDAVSDVHDDSDDNDSASTPCLGAAIEALLDRLDLADDDAIEPFALDATALDAEQARSAQQQRCDYKLVAQQIGADPRVLESNAELLREPHVVNQSHRPHHYAAASSSTANSALAGGSSAIGPSARTLSSDEARIEHVLHKCLTSVFASDDMLTTEDVRLCELRFKHQYARDLFVLILMQPSHQYVEMNSASTATSTGGSTWYNPKGAGNCIGATGFALLARLASTLMDECAGHEDFTNARGMLQVAFQYYHYVEDKHSGIGFAKKEYLVTPLRLRPICRSLDMWQHACTREIDAAVLADPLAAAVADERSTPNANAVADELFFSVIGSLVYDMLTVEVPVPKVHAFVSVMCSTYQKDADLRTTLTQLVENVHRALEMSKDAVKLPQPSAAPAVGLAGTTMSDPAAIGSAGSSVDTAVSTVQSNGSSAASRQYDLDTVIRRKMSTNDGLVAPPRSPLMRSLVGGTAVHENGSDSAVGHTARSSASESRRRAASSSSASFPCSVLANLSAPIWSMDIHQSRVACGLADSSICIVDTAVADKHVKLEGHTDAVVALQLRGSTLISGSRDHTLRAWDLRATPKRRQLFAFFSSGGSSSSGQRQSLSDNVAGSGSMDVDGACVSKQSLIWRGHTGAIACLEMGRQLATDRSLIASGADDSTIRLWDTTRDHSVAVLSHGAAGVHCLRFLPLHDYLASGCRAHLLKVWDVAISKLHTTIPAHRGTIVDIQVTGDRLVTASNDRVVKVWDAHFRTGQSYVHALREHGGPVQCVSLGGPADPNICTGSSDGVVRVWDLRYAQKGPRLALAGHVGQVTCLQRDFTKLVSGGEDGSLRVWDMHSGVCITDARAHMSGVTRVALRDSVVYSASWDGSVRLWDIDAANASLQQRA